MFLRLLAIFLASFGGIVLIFGGGFGIFLILASIALIATIEE
jgi:hypothetical protein